MILDKTWCEGARCARANTCSRWIEHLHKFLESPAGERFRLRSFSVAQFADHAGNCTRYEPLEKPEGGELGNAGTQ